ncbi:hypothetical protein ColLi_05482 [Colletotrichum liriopes]|uniref:Uncharacterized protein n=1 Tax=Colletotrichum liriopes TaxID=708192 RepID=A0AA37LRV4_9PEZI|nr:hypothetical protein ColLi_05482 [Colletotrichum liriopes]
MRPTLGLRAFRPTLRMMSPVPPLRRPAIPNTDLDDSPWRTGVVVGFALAAATYSVGRHFMTDKTIRLKRQGKSAADSSHGEEH